MLLLSLVSVLKQHKSETLRRGVVVNGKHTFSPELPHAAVVISEMESSKAKPTLFKEGSIISSLESWGKGLHSASLTASPFFPQWWDDQGCPPNASPLFSLLTALLFSDEASTSFLEGGIPRDDWTGANSSVAEVVSHYAPFVIAKLGFFISTYTLVGEIGPSRPPTEVILAALSHRVALKGALWEGLQSCWAHFPPAHSVSSPTLDSTNSTGLPPLSFNAGKQAPMGGGGRLREELVKMGQALIPPRSASLYLTEEGFADISEKASQFNSWWRDSIPSDTSGACFSVLPVEGGVLQGRVATFYKNNNASREGALKCGGGGGGGNTPLTFRVPLNLTMSVFSALACPDLGPPLLSLRESVGGGSG